MKIKRRICSVFLALCLCIGLMPMPALAAPGEIGGIDGGGNFPGDPGKSDIITSFREPTTEQQSIAVPFGTPLEDISFPNRLKVTFDGYANGSSVYDVKWKYDEYDAQTPGEYTFTAVCDQEKFTFADDIAFPTITVTVEAPLLPVEKTVEVSSWDALKIAVNQLGENEILKANILQSLEADSELTLDKKTVILSTSAENISITRTLESDPNFTNPIFNLKNNASLTIDGGEGGIALLDKIERKNSRSLIYAYTGTTVTLSNVSFSGLRFGWSQSSNVCSAVYAYNATVAMENITMTDCVGGDGVLIFANNSVVKMNHCTVKQTTYWGNNNSTGGVIRVKGSKSNVSIENSTIAKCGSAEEYGAANSVGAVHLTGGTVNISDSIISENMAMLGAGIHAQDTNLTLINVDVANNICRGDGYNDATGEPDGSKGNITWWQGSGLYIEDCNLTMSHVNITGNHGAFIGGGMYIHGTDVTMDNTVNISDNSAVCGGGIYADDASHTVTLNGAIIEDNKAIQNNAYDRYPLNNGCGAGIANDEGNIVIQDVQISGNIADVEGGAIMNAGALELCGGKISKNEAPVQGGSIINRGTLTMTGGEITGNTATGTDAAKNEGIGGGVANLGTFTMTGGKLYGNIAARGGNDFYNYAEKTAGGDVDIGVDDNWEGNHDMDLDSLLPVSRAAAAHGTFTLRPAEDFGFEGWFEDAPDKRYPENKTIYTPVTDDTDEKYLTIGEPTVQTVTVTFQPGDHGSLSGTTSYPVTAGSVFGTNGRAVPTVNADSNYEFTGWLGSDGNIYTNSQVLVLTIAGNMTFTAQYKAVSSGGGGSTGGGGGTTYYILHYESNGGTEYKDERYKKNTVVELDKVPTREGYTFTGWYADEELTDRITSIKMTSDKTVYAGWEPTGVPEWLNGDDHFAYVIGYTDGTVRPRAQIARSEVAAIFFRLLKPEIREEYLTDINPFDDVDEEDWYSKAVSTLYALDIFKGRTSTDFVPDAPITRAEFAVICARFDTGRTDGDSEFTDIAGHWAEAEIERAASLGWVQGDPAGRFHPDAFITRAEAMTMINRVLNRLPEDEDDLLDGMNVWPDNKPGDWYYLAVQEATNSHDFTRKGDVHEHWTKMTVDPDWSRYQ